LAREPRYLALFILSIIIASSTYMVWSAERGLGTITVEIMQITRTDGRTVDFSVYKPRILTYGKPLPAVLTIHGISASRGEMLPVNIELARRNFTVVSVDLAGHGVSSEIFGWDTFSEVVTDAYEAVRYVQANDPDTSQSTWGVLGHSLGAGVAMLMQVMPVQPNATVIIGGGMGENFGGLSMPLNQTNPRNLMIACGLYDELVSTDLAYATLRTATGLSNATSGTIYGNLSDGSARKLVLSATNHLFEISDTTIVMQSVDWLGRSLQGASQFDQHTLSISNHIFQYANLAGSFQTSAMLLSVFQLFLITYSKLPAKLKPRRINDEWTPVRSSRALRFSLLLGSVGAVLFLSLMFLGLIMEFAGINVVPVSFGTAFTLFSLAMFPVTVHFIGRSFGRHEMQPGVGHGFEKRFRQIADDILRSFVLVLPVVAWLCIWSYLSSLLAGSRIGATPQVIGGAVAFRAISTIVLTMTLLPLFYGDVLWLNRVVGVMSGWTSLISLSKKTVAIIVFRLAGFGILIAALYLPFLAGAQLGFVMFVALLMLPFAVLFGLSAVVALWAGGLSKNYMSAALLNALLLAVIIASTFQII
jgi:pimeloyl-ACP methyl ester carboxylesterase